MDAEEKDFMTKAQRDAVCKAWDILTEHFEHVLLVIDYDTEKDSESAHEGFWHGGSMAALGLAHFAADRILEKRITSNEP